MVNINFAIIGCGRIAQRHAEHINNLENGSLAAVCDIDFSQAEKLASLYSCKAYDNIRDLLDHPGIDVVSICTPNGLHAEHSIMVLNSGKHVLCEKPMAISVKDCGEMIKTAERNNKRLFIVKQNRFNPPIVALKNLIDNDRLGQIYSVQLNCFWNRNEAYYTNSWKGTLALDGGTLFTQFSHFIDLLYWLVGDVQEVKAFASNYHHKESIEFEDTGVVILKFANRALGCIHYTVNSYGQNMEGSITIFAEKGTVKVGGKYLNELEFEKIEGEAIGNLPEGNRPNNYGDYVGSMSNHDKVYANLVDVLLNNASVSTNMFEGFKTVEVIEKIYAQIRGQ